ncbi:MAG: hypothetical protein ACLFT6_05710 [Bacteroidales bacterium]
MKLNVKAFALASGIVLGLAILLVTIWYLLFGFEGETLRKIHHVCIGYSISIGGAFLGLIWGFIYGFIGGAIFSWCYNLLTGKPKEQ